MVLLVWCSWCGAEGSLEHILLHCPNTKYLHDKICQNSPLPWKMKSKSWIFGLEKSALNTIIWISNFAIYKAYLAACDGFKSDYLVLFHGDALHYAPLYLILSCIDWDNIFVDLS